MSNKNAKEKGGSLGVSNIAQKSRFNLFLLRFFYKLILFFVKLKIQMKIKLLISPQCFFLFFSFQVSVFPHPKKGTFPKTADIHHTKNQIYSTVSPPLFIFFTSYSNFTLYSFRIFRRSFNG